MTLFYIKKVSEDIPPHKRRKLEEDNNLPNISNLDPLVYNYESDSEENENNSDIQSINEFCSAEFIPPSTSKECTKEVTPLKRKRPISNYWETFPGASHSATADVCINVLETIIALWKGNNLEKPQIQIEIPDKELQEFGILISNKIKTNHPFISDRNKKFILDRKKKQLSNDIIAIGALLLNANEQLLNHQQFFSEFDKYYIRPIQALHDNIINLIKEMRAYLLPKNLDKLSKHKIISAPLCRNTIWNIPPECEKELASIHFKQKTFFRGQSNRRAFRGSRRFGRFHRGARPLTQKASTHKPPIKQSKK